MTAEAETTPPVPGSGSRPAPERPGLRLALVLAEDEGQRELLTRFFREQGYASVHSAPATTTAAADLGEEEVVARADLVALILPAAAPAEIWNVLRLIHARCAAPILVLAEHRSREVLRRALALGAAECLAWGPPNVDLELLALKVEKLRTAAVGEAVLENDRRRAQRLFVNVLSVLARILESKDSYTRFHSHNVAKLSRAVGRRRGLGENELDRLGLAALLHDLGKVGIPEAVLNKPAVLSEEEIVLVRRHPGIAAAILEPLPELADLVPTILHHHEWWNGQGYPGQLAGAGTPLWARIIAIADAYDTMISERRYKKPFSREQIRGELLRGRGTQFDPELVDILLGLMESNGELLSEVRSGGGSSGSRRAAVAPPAAPPPPAPSA